MESTATWCSSLGAREVIVYLFNLSVSVSEMKSNHNTKFQHVWRVTNVIARFDDFICTSEFSILRPTKMKVYKFKPSSRLWLPFIKFQREREYFGITLNLTYPAQTQTTTSNSQCKRIWSAVGPGWSLRWIIALTRGMPRMINTSHHIISGSRWIRVCPIGYVHRAECFHCLFRNIHGFGVRRRKQVIGLC